MFLYDDWDIPLLFSKGPAQTSKPGRPLLLCHCTRSRQSFHTQRDGSMALTGGLEGCLNPFEPTLNPEEEEQTDETIMPTI
jgi:hypothetical protein